MIKLKDMLKEEWSPIIYEIDNLFESPMRIGKWDMEQLSNNTKNVLFTRKIKELVKTSEQYKNFEVYTYNIKNINYTIFSKGEFTEAFFSYRIDVNNNFIEDKVWQYPISLGTCRDILFNYFLPKFNGIISDSSHSELGERYWIKLVDDAINKGYDVYVIFDNNKPMVKLNSSEEMNKFYGPISLHSRFLITKNKI